MRTSNTRLPLRGSFCLPVAFDVKCQKRKVFSVPRDPREYGLNPADREFEMRRKFGEVGAQEVSKLFQKVRAPTEQILGAIIFLAREQQLSDLEALIQLANEDQEKLLRAATVKDERG